MACKESFTRQEVSKSMEEQYALAIRERLGAFLAIGKVTKTSVAQSLGISLNTLNSKLNGHTPFTLGQAAKLADVMGCKLDDLRVQPYS